MARNGRRDGLSPGQGRAISALLTCQSIEQAAKQAGIGARTLHRWLTDPDFQAALTEAEGAAIAEATRRLVGLSDAAITTVASLMLDKGNSPTVRLRAATSVLDYLLRLRELKNVEERLTALEAAIDQPA